MPEGDTIWRAAERIRAGLGQDRIVRSQAISPRSGARTWAIRLEGRRLTRAESRGKHLFLDFEGEIVHSHLRMSGGWHVYRPGQRWRRSRNAAWLVLETANVTIVQFNGPVLRLITSTQKAALRLGPDLLAADFTPGVAAHSLLGAAEGRALGEALLDQRAVAGIGNIHKSEACFAARIDPWRAVSELTAEELERVVTEARNSLLAGLGGQRPRAVYRRRGRPCPACGKPIRSRGQGDDNRTTYWCPSCQA